LLWKDSICVKMVMKLSEAKRDHQYCLNEMKLSNDTLIRLQSLGMTKGTILFILNRKKGGSVIFKVRGSRLAVGKKIASCIDVEEAALSGMHP
jgi:ferrous iron transport protein A